MKYLIYRLINKINGKSYIGKTKNLKRRMTEHQYHTSCTYLYRAIKKYGIDNFEVSVIKDQLSFEKASLLECDSILEEKTLSPRGYNLVLDTFQGRRLHPDTIKKRQTMIRNFKPRNEFKGVSAVDNRWRCRIKNRNHIYEYRFNSPVKCAIIYDKLALHFWGINCYLNFPHKTKQYSKINCKALISKLERKKLKSSKYKGVAYHKKSGKWRSYQYDNKGKQIHLGLFKTEKEAFNACKNKCN